MAIKDIPASTILDIQNLIAQAPAYIKAVFDKANASGKAGQREPRFGGKARENQPYISPADYNTAANQLSDWFNKTIKPNATSTKDAKATISSTFTSIDDFNASFYNIRTSVMLADPIAVAFLDTWFKKYSKIIVNYNK